MIIIVDNGIGAQEISRLIRAKHEVMTPKEAATAKNASAYILTDGKPNHKAENLKIIANTKVPVLAIGTAATFTVSEYGAKIKEKKTKKQKIIKLNKACPLTLDLKKVFKVVDNCSVAVEELPEVFDVVASSSDYEYEIIENMEKPIFGVHFNPEAGMDGFMILRNFEKFIEIWERYHK